MMGTRARIDAPCTRCGKMLTFSERKLKRYGDFQIGCPSCKAIVSARAAFACLGRSQRESGKSGAGKGAAACSD